MKPLYDWPMWEPGYKPTTPCDEWAGSRWKGYGRISIERRRTYLAHRIVWMQDNGPIPAKLVIMHMCDNRACIRLDHLRVGTRAENDADMRAKRRESRPPAWAGTEAQRKSAEAMGRRTAEMNAKKTHCPHGHPYSGDNLIIGKSGSRFCRACRHASNARRRATATMSDTGLASEDVYAASR